MILPYISKDQINQHVVPIFLKAMKDPIPNVRFTIAKILKIAKNHIDSMVTNS